MDQPSSEQPDSTPPDFKPTTASAPPSLDDVRRALDRANAHLRADLEKLAGTTRESAGPAGRSPDEADLAESPPVQPDLPDPGAAIAPSHHPDAYPLLAGEEPSRSWPGKGLLVAICALLLLGVGVTAIVLARPPASASRSTPAVAAVAPGAAPGSSPTVAPTRTPTAAPPTTSLAIAIPTAMSGMTPAAGSPGDLPSTAPAAAVAPTVPLPPISTRALAPLPTTTVPPTAASVVQQVAGAEATLRTGEFEATIEYGDGIRSLVQVRFDLGDGQHPRRIYIVSTFQARTGSQNFEQVAIGDQTWQRQPDGSWARSSTQDGMWEQLQAYLPGARAITGATLVEGGGTAVLHYDDSGRDADSTLSVDTTTGTPLQLRQAIRPAGTVLTVTYRGWNVPVVIDPPATR